MAPLSPPRPSFARASLRVFDLSLGHMLWSRRSAFLALLVGGPVLLAILLRVSRSTGAPWRLPIDGAAIGGPAMFGLMIWLFYVRFIIPVLGVFYGTALIADEVDDKTITYLFSRPMPRGAVLIGKYLAFLACTGLLVLPSVVLVFFLVVGQRGVGGSFPALVADLGMLFAGLATYGSVFAWVGARLRRPLVIGLVFALGWEPAVLLFPGYLRRFTVAYYLQALVPHAMPADSSFGALLRVFQEVPTIAVSLASLTAITVTTLWLAARAVDTREYILEQ